MNNLINPYDLGEMQLVESSQKININDLLNKAKAELKLSLLRTQIEMLGIKIELTTSKTRFNGERFWFLCPNCKHRAGTIYKHPTSEIIGCRLCLGLKYKAQRYNGMIESNI